MPTILIVEDEEDLRLLMRLSLSREPYTFLEAATGADAAELWSSADLILLDLRLPDTDGLDLLRELGTTKAPIIAVSAYSADQLGRGSHGSRLCGLPHQAVQGVRAR